MTISFSRVWGYCVANAHATTPPQSCPTRTNRRTPFTSAKMWRIVLDCEDAAGSVKCASDLCSGDDVLFLAKRTAARTLGPVVPHGSPQGLELCERT